MPGYLRSRHSAGSNDGEQSHSRPEMANFDKFLLKVERSSERKTSQELSEVEFSRKRYYEELINLNGWSVDRLAIQPGETNFELWFLVSSYFPLIVGTIGPISNMTNIVSLIDSWRVDAVTGDKPPDFPWLLKLNGISVMFALLSNASLLLNTKNKMRYTWSQIISMAGWFLAATILLVLVVLGHHLYFKDSNYEPSQGFWFALFTVILYYCCFIVLVLNEVGFLLQKYPPVFNIDENQKNLMVLVIIFMLFLLCSSGVFSRLMSIDFADALYFVCVTILTVGLGDLTPQTVAGRALILLTSVIGLLLLALIVSIIRELVIFSASSTFYWNRSERHRVEKLKKLSRENRQISNEESFQAIEAIGKHSLLHEKAKSLVFVLGLFITFWLIGGLVFSKAESWDYGTACYFSFLCLLTIGYGVPSPQTYCGRAFFVLWGLAAVPLMTMLISNLSDILFSSLKDTSNYSLLDPLFHFTSRCLHVFRHLTQRIGTLIHEWIHKSEENDEPEGEELDMDEDTVESWNPGANTAGIFSPVEELPQDAPANARAVSEVLKITKELRRMMVLAIENPSTRFSYEEWKQMFELVGEEDVLSQDNFWISDDTPFKFPFREAHYFQFKYLFYVEKKLKKIMKDMELDYADARLREYSAEL